MPVPFLLCALEDPGSETGTTAGAAGRGEAAEGRHRSARRHDRPHPRAVAHDRGVRRLRLFHQHEGEADRGLARNCRQDKARRGAAGRAEGYARAE